MSYQGQLYPVRNVLPSNPTYQEPESYNQNSHGFVGSLQSFSQSGSLPQTSTSRISATSPLNNMLEPKSYFSSSSSASSIGSTATSMTSAYNPASDKGYWVESKDVDPQYGGQKHFIQTHSPNYTVNAPYPLASYPPSTTYPTSSSFSSQGGADHYQQYPAAQTTAGAPQHLPQQIPSTIVKPILNSQLKFPDTQDQTVMTTDGSFGQFLTAAPHHQLQYHQQPPYSQFAPHKHYSIPGALELPNGQLEPKFDEILHSTKNGKRKTGKVNKPGHQEDYICQHCGKVFAKNYNLKSHLKTHSDEKPFSCSFCTRSFARNHDKKRHELLHKGIKRFPCGGLLKDGVTRWGCGKRFSRADGLSRHFKTDVGWLCVRPLMLEAKNLEKDPNNFELEQNLATNLDINIINELIKKK